ncbi:putative toxin-antitoxin system toxin component, PIN family [Pedobacter changchengzhani]|uniref:Putative toxin-antitoxin system toxin component, PIN family n=1 Tax=Pedobacter changchengzhani TaxID=2529274 RepID=A0A4R5MKW1_9SPHI|nr:putative toxin-antitoxin system toxin component, PIN family [Pedobacter changchengzhani]TDG36301.1 putative toxin-antitoxin system toxin component, PIN family [Pedobacter changchengzhani]
MRKAKRIVIDTNLWISFLITKDYAKIDNILFSGKIILVFSTELLDEFIEVANRQKFKRFFSKLEIENFLETIEECADFTKVKTVVNICRDPKDNFLLSLSIDGNVDFLITGDKDLLDLNKIGKTKMLTMSDFLLTLRSK